MPLPRRALSLAVWVLASVFPANSPAQESPDPGPAWTAADSRLANHYIQLLQQDPSYGRVLDLLWDLYVKKDQTPLLLDYFKGAAESGPEVAQLIYAHLLRKSGDTEAARVLYDRVLEREPKSLPALLALAEIADQQNRAAKALSLYTRLAELLPPGDEGSRPVRLRKAALYRQQGQTAEAVAEWKALLRDFPGEDGLRREVVGLLLEAGETAAAAGALAALAESGEPRRRLEALAELSRLQEFAGDFDACLAASREGMALLHFKSPEYADFFARVVRLHERFDRLGELRGELSAAAAAPNTPERALHDLAEFFRLTADPAGEEEAVARLAAAVPADASHRIRLAELQLRNDRYQDAAATLDGLLRESGTASLPLKLRRALVDLHGAGREAAERRLAAILDEGGLDAKGRREVLEFARRHHLDGLVERLLREPGALADEGSDGFSAPVELARFLHERGRIDAARQALADYVAAAGGAPLERAERLHRVAGVYKDLGQPEEAVAALDEALALAPGQFEYQSARADLYIATKQIDRAIAQLEEIREGRATLEDRAEIDQRLFSLLRGFYATRTDAEGVGNFNVLNQGAVQSLAEYRRLAAAASRASSGNTDEPPPQELVDYYESVKKAANDSPSTERRYRAAWWALKMLDNQECYHQLTLANEEAGKPVVAVEKMLLSLAEQNERPTLMVRHLSTLIEIDPDHAADYRQRRAEMRFELGFEDEAVRELKDLAARPGASLATINTLAKLYQRQGSPGKQVEVWQRAYREADLVGKRAVVKQLSNALVESGQPEEALAVQIDLLERETDSLQRRKQLDAQVTVAQTHFLLDWMRERYAALAARHPLDRFFPEALARIHRAAGEDREAYEAMRRAYYLSGRGEELLPELGALSDRLGDLDAAIYYRRQLLARGEGDTLENWKELVRMLEKDLRVAEADVLRRRLETRFGSDTDFLSELASHYSKSGRPGDAARVLSRLTALRPWDLVARFRLGLLESALERPGEALAAFEAVLTGTAGSPWPDGFAEGRLPLVRVSASLADGPGAEPGGLGPFVFTVEGYPFVGGNLQDEIADALQRPREEFTPVPEEPHLLRLRAIEEAAALSVRLGRVPDWLARWRKGDRPLIERLWATRHAGAGAAFADCLGELPNRGSHADQLLHAYARLLSGESARTLAWVDADDSASGTQHPRSLYAALAALILLKDGFEDPQYDEAGVCGVLAKLGVAGNLATHHFSDLRKAGRFGTAYRVGSLFADSVLADEPAFHFALSQVAGLAGAPQDRARWLDRSLAPFEGGNHHRGGHFFVALTEKLSLLDSDAERAACLARFAAPAGIGSPERAALLALARGDRDGVVASLRPLVESQSADSPPAVAFEPLEAEPSQRWQRLNRVLHYYSGRLRLDAANGPAFVAAFATAPPIHPADPSVAAQFEEFEIDRELLALEWLNAPEREARVRELRGFLKEPESRMELAKALESRGFHREAVPVYRDDAIRRDRDYAPLQGLFDAASEALDPAPALEVIARINTREFPAPPGLTVDYLNERHARFLLLDGDLGRLAQLGRVPTVREGTPPVTSRSHLPYEDALVEGYRRFGDDASLLRLLGGMRDRDGASEPQLLLGAETLAKAGRHEEALAWLEPLTRDASEALLQRRALLLSLESHAALGWRDASSLRALLLAGLGRQPAAVTRQLAAALHRGGSSEEAIGALELLRRGTGDPAQRTATSMEILRVARESGRPWEDLGGELDAFLLDFVYRLDDDDTLPSEPRASFPGSRAEAIVPNASRWIGWIVALPEADRAGFTATLAAIRPPERNRWLAELLLAWQQGRLEPGARRLLSDLVPGSPGHSQILETLPAFGPGGAALARVLVESEGLPGPALFPNEPARQISFYHRIGDRSRLVEVHSELVRETRSDLFHQSGLEEWVPTLERRRRLPVLFASIGETELARGLFLACDRSIASYQWNHLGFLNDYGAFLVESGAHAEAEDFLRRVLRKSLRLDLRVLPRLYAAWEKTGEWEERVRGFHLTRGQERLLEGWMSALAEGRELREIRDSW